MTQKTSRDETSATARAAAYGSRGFIPLGPARLQAFGAKLRAKEITRDGGKFFEVEGYASVTEKPYTMYDMFGPYEETVKKSAFDSSLERDDLDVAWLVNHKGVTMARTKNNTLELWADTTGLGARAWLNANRQDVRDIVSAIDDELVDEMSFAFYLTAGGWNEDYDKFTIYEADIHRGDVSAVNYGANPYTSIGARAPEILAELAHLPAGAARAAFAQLTRRFGAPVPVVSRAGAAGRALTGMDADEKVTELIAALDAALDSASDLVVDLDPALVPPEVAQALDLLTGAESIADELMDLLGIDDPDDTDTDEALSASAPRLRFVPRKRATGFSALLAEFDEPAAREAHGAHDGSHSHPHPAYGSQGSDAEHDHEHSHAGDDNHDHAHGNAAPSPAGNPGRETGSRVMSLALVMAQQEYDNELDASDAIA